MRAKKELKDMATVVKSQKIKERKKKDRGFKG